MRYLMNALDFDERASGNGVRFAAIRLTPQLHFNYDHVAEPSLASFVEIVFSPDILERMQRCATLVLL